MKTLPMTVSVHLRDDTHIEARNTEHYVWITIGETLHIHLDSENQIGELAQALDMASAMLFRGV